MKISSGSSSVATHRLSLPPPPPVTHASHRIALAPMATMSGTARVWTPPPSRWARLRAGAGTLVLLSFVTSTSLNYARLTRERREERRLHAIQCRVLRQLHEQLATSSFHARASTSRVTLDEQRLLAARLRAVQLDPRAVGISKRGTRLRGGRGGILDDDDGNANDDDDEDESRIQQIRTAQTSWKTILFGGDGTGSRIKQAIGATVQAVRRGEGPTTGGSEDGMDEAERAWLQELEQSLEAEEKGAEEEKRHARTMGGDALQRDFAHKEEISQSHSQQDERRAPHVSGWLARLLRARQEDDSERDRRDRRDPAQSSDARDTSNARRRVYM